MKLPTRTRREEVEVRHRATLAQPPHAAGLFIQRSSSSRASLPSPPTANLETLGVLLKGLRRNPLAYPLLETTDSRRKNMPRVLGDFR